MRAYLHVRVGEPGQAQDLYAAAAAAATKAAERDHLLRQAARLRRTGQDPGCTA